MSTEEKLRYLKRENATVVLLDTPEGTPVGIDAHVFLAASRFSGFKMVPPGFHLLVAGHSPARAFHAIHVSARTFAAFRFCPETERYRPIPSDSGEMTSLARAVTEEMAFDAGLAAYPLLHTRTQCDHPAAPDPPEEPDGGKESGVLRWPGMHAHVTAGVVAAVAGGGAGCWEPEEMDWSVPPRVPGPGKYEGLAQRQRDGATPEEVTRHAVDGSDVLSHVATRFGCGDRAPPEAAVLAVLGEQELAFACFLHGECERAMRAWVSLTQLLCRSRRHLTASAAALRAVCTSIRMQLERCSEDIVPRKGFVHRAALERLADTAEECRDPDGRASFARLSQTLESKFGIRVEADTGDVIPVSAEADQDGGAPLAFRGCEDDDEDGPVVVLDVSLDGLQL